MDVTRIIAELRSERERLDGIISALERLGADGQFASSPKRRGRKFMDKAGRLEVSERMKRYWAARREQGGEGESEKASVVSSARAGASRASARSA